MRTATDSVVLGVMIGMTAFLALVGPAAAFAQRPGWSIQHENDWYLGKDPGEPFENDDDYTHGLRISVQFPRAIGWGKWVKHADCSDKPPGPPCLRTTVMFGHSWYTPTEITRTDVLEDDRPYAAWAYVGVAGHIARDDELQTLELAIGTTGKLAFGGEFQSWWHRVIKYPPPRGWPHQVKPVRGLVGVNGSWDHQFAHQWKTGSSWPFVLEINPSYRLSLGNVLTTAAGGAIVRAGYNVQRRWTQKIPGTRNEREKTRNEREKWDVHGFGGGEVRGVGWNAFLQHDTYTPRRLPDISRVVCDWEFGLAAGRGRFFGGFRWVYRSPEYDGGRPSKYGGLFFTVAPNIR